MISGKQEYIYAQSMDLLPIGLSGRQMGADREGKRGGETRDRRQARRSRWWEELVTVLNYWTGVRMKGRN